MCTWYKIIDCTILVLPRYHDVYVVCLVKFVMMSIVLYNINVVHVCRNVSIVAGMYSY